MYSRMHVSACTRALFRFLCDSEYSYVAFLALSNMLYSNIVIEGIQRPTILLRKKNPFPPLLRFDHVACAQGQQKCLQRNK